MSEAGVPVQRPGDPGGPMRRDDGGTGAAIRRAVRRRPVLVVASVLLLALTAIAIAAPWLAPFDPESLQPQHRLKAPGGEFVMGTDRYGRDVYSRVLYGGRISLLVGWSVTAGVLLFGGTIGLLAGFSPRADRTLMRVMDGLMAFPDVLLAIALMAALGPNVVNVIVALTAVYIPRMARIVRSSTLVVKEQLYVEAAHATGSSIGRVIVQHVLPGTLPAAMVQATVTFAYAVLAEAALSFLGVGAPPSIPSWGNIISDGRLYIRQAPWILIYPGIAVVTTVLAINMLGDALRDLLDPRMQSTLRKGNV